MKITIGDAAVAAVSPEPEPRWGYHQFPTLSPLPDGRILLTFNASEDRDASYVRPSPAWVSEDAGRSWAPFGERAELTVSHSPISPVLNGEYFAANPIFALDASEMDLPEPVGAMDCYGQVDLLDLDACPPAVRQYHERVPALRWTPSTGWRPETITWDTRNMLARRRDGLITRASFQCPLLIDGRELLHAEYVVNYRLPDGGVPRGMSVQLMASEDNGRTWTRRALIASDPTGEDNFGEPHIGRTTAGELVCVLRREDHRHKPMAITYSADDGRTWTRPESFQEFGVLPQLLLLGCGAMVLSFGRPGVWMTLSPSGDGRDWTAPTAIIAGDHERLKAHSCGYTSMIPLGDDELLLAYSDFTARDGRKAICVRRCRVRP